MINGLFLLVFLLILPQFDIGYLIALAIFFAIPLFVMRLFVLGQFLIFSLFYLVDIILAEPHKILNALGKMLSNVRFVIVIGIVALIWAVMIYFNEKANNSTAEE